MLNQFHILFYTAFTIMLFAELSTMKLSLLMYIFGSSKTINGLLYFYIVSHYNFILNNLILKASTRLTMAAVISVS